MPLVFPALAIVKPTETMSSLGVPGATGATGAAGSAADVMWLEDTTIYVSTAGSDSNDGLSISTPFASLSAAMDLAGSKLIRAGVTVTVSVSGGIYIITEPVYGSVFGAGSLKIIGDADSPANVEIITAKAFPSDTGIFTFQGAWGGRTSLSGFSLAAMDESNAGGIVVRDGAYLEFSSIVFGSFVTGSHIVALTGGIVVPVGDYSITGGGFAHIAVAFGGSFTMLGASPIVAISGTPEFSDCFCFAANHAMASVDGLTFAGSATGKRFSIVNLSLVTGTGADPNFFPGDVAGTVADDSVYS